MLVQINGTVILRSVKARWRRPLQWQALQFGMASDGEKSWGTITNPCSADDMHQTLIEWDIPPSKIYLFLVAANYPPAVLDILQTQPKRTPKTSNRLRPAPNPHMQLSNEWQGKHTHEASWDRHG